MALAVQIFGPKEPATVTALSIECAIIVVFVVMGTSVMQLLDREDDSGDSADTSSEEDPRLTGSQPDIEQGSEK